MRYWRSILPLLLLAPASLAAQDSLPGQAALQPKPPILATLSLQEALDEARLNSPTFRQTANDAGPARWAVRNAWASLLPSWSVNGSLSYTGVGESQFGGGLTNRSPAFVGSGYGMSLTLNWDGTAFTAPGLENANSRATEANIDLADVSLTANITDQYLAALQAEAQVDVAREQVRRNQVFLDLAQARFRLGQNTLVDVRQAEATLAQSRSVLIVNEQNEAAAKLELFRQMGLMPPVDPRSIGLSSEFPVVQPGFDLEVLMDMADRGSPNLRASRAQEDAAAWSLRSAKSAFLPRLTAQASWGGFTQQFTDDAEIIGLSTSRAQGGLASCTRFNEINSGIGLPTDPNCTAANFGLVPDGSALTPQAASTAVDQASTFPLDFTSNPFRAFVQVSLPIFTGFNRSLSVSRAEAAKEDADEAVRATELQTRATVHTRYLALVTAYQAIGIEETRRTAAREQLRLAQDRYRLGSGNATELSDAQNSVASAEGTYVNAVYAYHRALAALEQAVGSPLR